MPIAPDESTAPTIKATPRAPAKIDAEVDATEMEQSADQAPNALTWLLGCAPVTDTPMSVAEQDALIALDKTLALPSIPDNLLPRAAALIPQLIALVRQTDLPVPTIAARVGKDAVLAAELMRLASSPYYRVQGEITNLEQAITMIGLQGLQTVIARVVLKPIYKAAPGTLGAPALRRTWEHSEALARHAAILAGQAGQQVFDGYLAGMLHDTGWTVALTVIDRANIALALPPSAAFATMMDDRVHRLFGHAARRWDITPGFTAFAVDARRNGPIEGSDPLALVMLQAHRRCMEELAPPATAPARLEA